MGSIKIHYVTVLLLLLQISLRAQVTVDINSGNPAFPFPQFFGYDIGTDTLFSLGTNNPEGVSHAEMEQTIRDAYQIMANRFIYTEEEYAGIQYIKGNEGCPYDCAEGDGYAMLAAAYMADKTTFDGLWMRTHDLKMTGQKKYSDCTDAVPDYQYGDNHIIEPENTTASDGNFDIALALCVAYKQWGESSGIIDACGNEISYKQECLNVLKGLTDTLYRNEIERYVSGSIGIDGYVKAGDAWGELTDWASNTAILPEFAGPQALYVDYTAPAYFQEFGNILQSEDPQAYEWNIKQYKRADASSDWLIGQHFQSDPEAIPIAGRVSIINNEISFDNINAAEDDRWSWRNAMDYMWHGTPTESWNPETHQTASGSNTYQKDMALRFASFLKNPQGEPWNNSCSSNGINSLSYKGTSKLGYDYTKLGKPNNSIQKNWLLGAGASAAVVAQDHELMALLYRQCELMWDGTEGYLESTPVYFDGWFRLLGMLTLTGNMQAPMAMNPQPNLRTYISTDKTIASINEEITVTVDYRNYGSIDATDMYITSELPEGVEFVSATQGGTYNAETRNVTWNIALLPGYTNAESLANTQGSLQYIITPSFTAPKKIKPQATISCANGFTAPSNSFPNTISSTYTKNEIDIITNNYHITKTASADTVYNDSLFTYTLTYKTEGSGYLEGGRPDVGFSVANEISSATQLLKFRILHNAQEAYIDNSNYRYSYFYYDTINPIDFNIVTHIESIGYDRENTTFSYESLPEGSDENGKWNRRLIVHYQSDISTPLSYIDGYMGLSKYIRKGELDPFSSVIALNNKENWNEDWSAHSLYSTNDVHFPISPNYSHGEMQEVTSYNTDICNEPSQITTSILVEEFDGYVWRIVAGNAPEIQLNTKAVRIVDTIPEDFIFSDVISELPAGVIQNRTGNILTWEIPSLPEGTEFSISYNVLASNKSLVDRQYSSSAVIRDETGTIATSQTTVTVLPDKQESLSIAIESIKNESHTGSSDGSIAVSIEGGKKPYRYAWSNGETTEDIDQLSEGTYTLTVTDADENTKTAVVTVGVDEVILPIAITLDSTANESYTNAKDGALYISIEGGKEPYEFVWSNGATTQDINQLSEGTYALTVTGAYGNTQKLSATVGVDKKIEPLSIRSLIINESYPNANNGSIDITVEGGLQPYRYLWNNNSTSEDIVNSKNGYYSVTVKDALNNELSMDFEIIADTIPDELKIIPEVTNELFTDDSNGSIEITIEGGLEPYTYKWSTGETTKDISNITQGGYSVTVTDKTGTTITKTIYVSAENPPLSISGTVSSVYGTVTSGVVLLYKKENILLQPFKSFQMEDSNTFLFDSLTKGIYCIYAIPSPVNYPSICPSYYNEASKWQNAYEIELHENITNITMLLDEQSTIQEGNGTISGTVGFSSNIYEDDFYSGLFNPDKPVSKNKAKNIVTYLTLNDEIVRWALTDNNGEFTFSNLPDGDYTIIVEKPGTIQMTKEISLTENNNNISKLKLNFDESVEISTKEAVVIYPNPTSNMLFTSVNTVEMIQVYNIEGRLVLQNRYENSIQLSSLSPGSYTIKIISNETVYYNSIIKN